MRRRACRPPLLRATASRGSIGRADPRRQHRDDLPPLLLASAPAFRKDAVNEAVQPSSPPVVAGGASAYHAGGRGLEPRRSRPLTPLFRQFRMGPPLDRGVRTCSAIVALIKR